MVSTAIVTGSSDTTKTPITANGSIRCHALGARASNGSPARAGVRNAMANRSHPTGGRGSRAAPAVHAPASGLLPAAALRTLSLMIPPAYAHAPPTGIRDGLVPPAHPAR
ncbi:hypothetical protein Slala02_07830 [Streptomyces lavendulae subsp. lavendulae]|nr:hypothetical protein Slala01_08220 [Streptomyces lavendulae subsp. lavendulae]GLX24963.1 hypothetical protein Slala02_07830 [Streptomyces lavendulae subsp. lavendulae]